MKNIYIVIVTYNGMAWLKQCLDSCKEYRVIVVDNNSSDESVSFIKVNYPDITLLEQDINLGFGQANNLGILYALEKDAEHVFLLNQDAYLVGNVLEKMVSIQQKQPVFGVLSPIHITADKKRLDKNFSSFMLKEQTGQFYSDFVLGNTLKNVYHVPFVNAAGWLISKSCLDTVGGFDPLFFHYGEDDNYCQRVLYHGFHIGVVPNIFIIHDRTERVHKKLIIYTDAYYKKLELSYKVHYGNILSNNHIEKKIHKLERLIVKAILQFKLNRISHYKKELRILKSLRPLIEKSREKNVTKGRHYLQN
ncbi:Glycosyltransferase, GT2 family [Formosa sp. Hel1_31_208]|uniref:glycosyltransferase family 2 protein n=1 Tax=Formosa sp. Hel1_31_208 TaxID=1798225 RepID=UPI00087A6CCC|nr:glycosyltransferase family 2 protein [Formosa sp. Hel1_31_208]SDS69355.1 Glycosyltransferase, GT2 family [Formosa sp. Hel1_31_208]